MVTACAIEPAVISDHTRRVFERALGKIKAGGRTALCGGLELGLEKAAVQKQENNLVLLLSDGQANEGETDIEAVGERAYRARQQGVIVSTLGVGADYNEALMVEIATQGGGRFYHVLEVLARYDMWCAVLGAITRCQVANRRVGYVMAGTAEIHVTMKL